MEQILGDDNYMDIDLQELEGRFGTSTLYGSRLVGSSDMSYLPVKGTAAGLSVFKMATGGDLQFVEFKGKDGFSYVYDGLLWFCSSQTLEGLLATLNNHANNVSDRIIFVHCPNVVPPEEQDHELLEKMYAEREGVVYKAIIALKSVIENRYRFTTEALAA